MLIGLVSVLCVLSVPLFGGNLRRLADLRLRGGGFLITALGLQILFIEVIPDAPEPLPAIGHVVSYGLIAGALWCNRHVPFLWLIGLGGLLNAIAITANGGIMPAREGALAAAGLSADGGGFENSDAVAGANVPWLGDVFAVPAGWPAANVFSVGDVLIVAGVFLALQVWCRSDRQHELAADVPAL